MRKYKKDMKSTYSDNDKNWNHGTYKVDVVGTVEQLGHIKTYTDGYGYNQQQSHQKYFMKLVKVETNGEAFEELKVMVDCCERVRQENRPSVGSKVHFKTTKLNGWVNISEGAPFEFWGKLLKEKDDRVWMGGNENLIVLKVKPKSVLVGWIKPINADDELPAELSFAQKYRNETDVPIFHWAEGKRKKSKPYFDGTGQAESGVLWCGTNFYTGGFVHETSEKRQVNCKRCLKKMGLKDTLSDVLMLSTHFPKHHVRLKGDTMDVVIDHVDVRKPCEVADWIWKVKLEEADWFVEVKRVRTEHVDDVLDLYVPKRWEL